MSRGSTGHVRVPNLHPDDLVDDRELAAAKDDRLAHEGIVDQLAALATTVTTPSNIALYGPWGSGKSGIANLLKARIDGRGGVRFVRFDAFKYADVPLRRNFISAVATELKCTKPKYHGDLYSGRTKTEITVPPTTVLKLLGVFALLLLGLTVILAVVVSAVALGQSRIGENTGFGVEFKALSKQVVLAGLAPATLLAALLALGSRTFSVDRSLAKPESDEQFEGIFKDLVSDAGAERLVIFVDELDRCSASEVVTTLDTIRTFLGIDRCVFIVAADQNVLEGALTRAAKQETPADDANPYYSTGSAYLDKVFQYQLSLPPLLTQSISKYAATLVESRKGLWAEVNREYVLSVLIPTHISSPRRVKHLLNTFALTYRLAQERHTADLLADDPRKNPAAIARLVCLRVEFPLFARHLEVDANLPALVLQLMRDRDAELPAGTTDRAVELAKSYALESAAPSTVLVEDEADGGDEAEDRATEIGKAHNKQLLNYLSRTRQVRGPSRDLIYLQSTGTVFGLDGELALAVERAAEDADIDTLQRRIDGLEDSEREGVLQVLTNQIRTGVGLAGPNAARSFLLLAEVEPRLPLATVADTVAEAICVLEDDTNDFLDEDTATSAWALAKVGSEASASALRRRVVAAITRPGFTTPDFLFADAALALGAAPAVVAEFLSARVVSPAGPATISRLFQLADDDLMKVITAIQDRTSSLARDAARSHVKWVTEQKAATTAANTTPARRTAAAAAATDEPEPEPFNPKVVLDALAHEAGARETPVQHRVLRVLLDSDSQDARHAALRLLGRTEPTSDPDLAARILKATRNRVLGDWPDWLASIVPSTMTATHIEPLTRLVAKAWSEKAPLDTTGSALDALRPFLAALPDGMVPTLNPDVLELVEPYVTSSEEATERRDILDRARLFSDVGVLNYGEILSVVANSLQDTLAESTSRVDTDDALYLYLVENGVEAIRTCADQLDDQKVLGLIAEAATSPWLNDLGHVTVQLELARSAGPTHVRPADLPSAETMADITYNYEDAAVHAVALWFELTHPNPEHFADVYDPLRSADVHSAELVTAAHIVQQEWTSEQHRALLDKYLAAADADLPNDSVLRTLGLATADDAQVADLLVSRFSGATNNTQRQAIVTLWGKGNIQDNASRRRLFETVVYGLLDLQANGGNNGAAEIALNALANVGKPLPPRIKGALGERVKAAVTGSKTLEQKALSVLPTLGYSTSSNFFGKAKRVNYET
ncbi:hypothetical protein BJF86_11925 [Serinicoccus sp. CNJ-927]|uniref:KAP family P-loop NTPase fold protein n=1 Tax=Serinicoccus sp. CNJ-927 TaxID=1904970 RepID=UPI000966ECE5|nr:P-loop NTPase fold protein [Serinicoccus sp. CNJ-927]OLT44654.1 hypothetical protein BJF86_11925 [Serinicoccus sp. CNJ-927]